MKSLKNLKLKSKFLLIFISILILVLILGFKGGYNIIYTNNTYYTAFKLNEATVTSGMEITKNIAEIRRCLTVLVYSGKLTDELAKNIEESYSNVKKASEKYLNIMTEIENYGNDRSKDKKNLEIFLDELDEYYKLYKKLEGLVNIEGKMDEKLSITKQMVEIGQKFTKLAYQIQDDSLHTLISEMGDVNKKINRNLISFFLAFGVIVILTSFAGIILSRIIVGPIVKLKDIALKVSKGDLNVNASSNSRDELGQLSNAIESMSDTFREIVFEINKLSNELDNGNIKYRIDENKYEGTFRETIIAINNATNNLIEETAYVIDKVKEFANGNFDFEIKEFLGEKVIIKTELKAVQDTLKDVLNSIKNLILSTEEGNIDFRLDTLEYVGQWKEITQGLNNLLENVAKPVKETQKVLTELSLGNLSCRMEGEYKGEFNNIKENVNYTSETISSYVSEISDILNQMANKNFDISIDKKYLGDFEQIQKSVNLIVENLNILTRDIISSAEQVSMGAKQISHSSVTLAEGATEQAASVERLNSIINEISIQSQNNVENSEIASKLALESKNSTNESSKQMNDMLKAMEEINNAAGSISNIIKVIDDIAFQTNILALNAAVEAARAGEHGKGFAVVAEEVRSLAGRSQEAAKETTELIKNSTQIVQEGSIIANTTAQSLLNVVNQIEEISKLTIACAESSKEQQESIQSVLRGITEISTVTQNNTATSEESAAAAEELSNQSETFYTSVSDFKLKEDI